MQVYIMSDALVVIPLVGIAGERCRAAGYRYATLDTVTPRKI